MKKHRCIAALAAFSLTLTGCGFTTASIDSLLAPPKLSEQQSEIFSALKNAKGSSLTLKYPKSGDYRSAFVVADIDDEPTDEAMVFYEASGITAGNSVWLNFLDQRGGEWVSVYDLPILGSEIEKIAITPLGDSEKTNIILGYTELNQSGKVLSVIDYNNGIPTELMKASYSASMVCDLDENDENELLLVEFDKSLSTALASTYSRTGDTISHISSVALDPSASEYSSVISGFVSGYSGEKKPAVFLDFAKGDGSSGTDVLYCYGSRLINPIYSIDSALSSTLSRFSNSYTATAYSADIDKDGFTEIPANEPFPAYENLTLPEKINATIWYSLTSFGQLTRKYYSYYSINNDFVFFFPGRWEGLVTVTLENGGNSITFWQTESGTSTDSLNEERRLLSLKVIDTNTLGSEELSGWTYYAAAKSKSYYIQWNYQNSLSLTTDELDDCLRLF